MTALDPHRMTIGPVGLDIPLHLSRTGQWRGDVATVGGSFGDMDDVDQCRHLRNQLQGLSSLTRTVVPCRFWDTPELDGYYVLGDVTITTDDNSFASGAFDLSLTLTRPSAWQQLVQQEIVIGGLRTQPDGTVNAHSIGLGDVIAWHSPGVETFGLLVDGEVLGGGETVGSADGDIDIVWDTAETLFNATARWWVDPADFDRGAAQIRVSPGHDGRYWRVVGAQVVNHPEHWMLTNGRITFRQARRTVAGPGLTFEVEFNRGDGWVARKVFQITVGPDAIFPPRLVRVARESPERSALRCVYATNGGGFFTLDAQLRRGASHVECVLSGPGPIHWGIREVDPDPTVAFFAEPGQCHTSGVHAKSYDPGGVKVWLTSPQEVTPDSGDTSNVAMTLVDEASQFAFGIGGEHQPEDSTYTDGVHRYFHAAFTHQRPVLA